jgi:N-acetylmuramoyl-L-alanine amidase
MTAALLLAIFALAHDSVRVHGVARDTTLTVVSTPAGGALRADAVLRLIGGSVRMTQPGRWRIDAAGASFTLVDGVPFATTKDSTIPLAAAPVVRNGALLLPLALLADIAPRIGNLAWDPGRRELRTFRVLTRNVSASSAPVAAPPAAPPAAAPPAPVPPPRRRTIVVDAGHGGPDAGMHGPIGARTTLYEKDVTIAVAKKLARELASRGVGVVMTRTTDTLIALGDRGRIANQAKGDLFISIHVNAANLNWKDPAAARGFETYFLAEAKTEDEKRVAQMENDVVRFETTGDPAQDGLGFILKDMAQNEQLRESSDLAGTIQSRLAKIHPGPSRGVKQAGFVVLVTAFMPAVLVEIGFGTNAAEAAYIQSDAGQHAIAGAVADAAMQYLAHYQRRVTGSASSQEPRQ